jgi:uncharacterized protein YjdB
MNNSFFATAGKRIKCKSVKLNVSKATILVGDVVTLSAVMNPKNSTETIKWKSNNKKIATVNQMGCVTAISPGTATITINDSFYVLNGVFGNSILTGTLEYASGTYSYIIKNDNIYELQGEEQVLKNELLNDIDKDIIMNDSLIKILKGNSGIKIEEEGKTIYKYNNIVINGITYTGEVSVINNNISNINLISDTHKYKFNYNNQ